MAASNASASLGEDAETRTSASRKSVEPNSEEEVHNDNEKLDLGKVDETPVAPDDSLLATPKTSPSKRISQGKADGGSEETESAMNYSSSPTSDPEKSAPSSPQTSLNQPVVSHVPASVQQPVLQSEHSSLASSAATIIPQQLHVDVDSTIVQRTATTTTTSTATSYRGETFCRSDFGDSWNSGSGCDETKGTFSAVARL